MQWPSTTTITDSSLARISNTKPKEKPEEHIPKNNIHVQGSNKIKHSALSPFWEAELFGSMDSQVSGQSGHSLDADVKNDHLDTEELDTYRSSNEINNENCFEDSESYLISINNGNREPEEVVGLIGDGIPTGDEAAGFLTRDEMNPLNDMMQFHVKHNDDNNWQDTGVHDSQGKFRFSQEMRSLQRTKNQTESKVNTDVSLAETSEEQRPLGRDEFALPDPGAADKENETRTPATNLKRAIGMLEENLDQLRNLYIKQEIENSRNILEVDPAKQDHDLINCLRRDLFSYEQQLLMMQGDLQLAQQNIEVLNTEKQNLAAHLAYERQMGALCLQSDTDQLTRISTTMETENGCGSSSPSLTPIQQAALKTEIGRLVKVLELEELRLMKSIGSNTSGNTERQLAHNCICLKPVEQSTDSKYSSTGVFYQKRVRPASVGTVRCRSAPVKTTSPAMSLVNSNGLGQGKDYFQTLYSDVRHRQNGGMTGTVNRQADRNFTAELLTRSSSSALHDLHIVEIQRDGKFVRLANSSNTVDYQLGNYILQQNIGGHPVAVFRFPPRVHCSALATVTVWSEGCETALHCPPSNFIFKGKQKWSTGSHVSTILCQPNGQAIAWSTALPKQYFHKAIISCMDEDELGKLPKATDSENFVFGREKTMENSLHTNELLISPEPQTSETVSKSSLKRTAIPGLPFAGASGRRLGSASLRRYHTRPFSATQL